MEHGFYHPSRGYWQTTDYPAQVFIDGWPEGTIEVPLPPSPLHTLVGSEWVGPTPEAHATADAGALQASRERMVCSRMQGILALGETNWQEILDYRDEHASWAARMVIDGASEWRRTSEDIAFFGFLLNFTDIEMDDLFTLAMQIKA